MRRVFAVLGAIAMVAVALVARSAIDDDADDDRSGGDGEVVLACDAELSDVCEALSGVTVVVADSACTSAAIMDRSDQQPDLWLTSSAWYEVTAGRAEGAIDAAGAVATTRVVTAVVADRASALEALCASSSLWRCLGDNAGASWEELGGSSLWGTLRTGLPDADTATGLGVLVAVAIGHFDGTDFATNDFDATRFPTWLGRLADPAGDGDADPAATLYGRPGTYSAAGTSEARLDHIGRSATALVPEPVVDLDLVLVSLDGGFPTELAADLTQLLVDAEWQPASGLPQELLKAGVTGALHDLWKDVTR